MSNTFQNEAELFRGDKLQVSGDVIIIESVGLKSADGVSLTTGKSVEVANPYPKNFILQRGCVAELDALLIKNQKQPPPKKMSELATKRNSAAIQNSETQNSTREMKRHLVELEPGDQLCHGGELRTCTQLSTDGKRALLCSLTDADEIKATVWEKRVVNDLLFTDCVSSTIHRFDAEQRADNLKRFLARCKGPPPREEPTTGGAEEKETEMKTKKEKKAKTPRTPKAAKPAVSYAGRPEYIEKLIANGDTDAAIMASVKEKYPGSSKGHVQKCIKAKRAKVKAE